MIGRTLAGGRGGYRVGTGGQRIQYRRLLDPVAVGAVARRLGDDVAADVSTELES